MGSLSKVDLADGLSGAIILRYIPVVTPAFVVPTPLNFPPSWVNQFQVANADLKIDTALFTLQPGAECLPKMIRSFALSC